MQLILFLALVVAIVILYAGFKELNKKIKHSIVVALVLVFILGGVYSFVVDRQTLGNRELVNHFNQGKTLICKEYG